MYDTEGEHGGDGASLKKKKIVRVVNEVVRAR